MNADITGLKYLLYKDLYTHCINQVLKVFYDDYDS